MVVTVDQIKALREETGAGIMDCRTALEKSNGDYNQAIELLREKGMATALKRSDRVASEGIVELYSHGGGRVGVMVEVNCETDFVARSEAFRKFAHEIALQIAAGEPRFIRQADIPEDVLAKERERARLLAVSEGKSESVLDRIVDGRIAKFVDEVCLLNQVYIRDDTLTVEKLLMQNIGSIGENIVIRRFQRWELGEEVEE